MSPIAQKALRLSGSVLAIAGIIFVVIRFNTYSSQLQFVHFNAFEWSIIAGFATVYGFANTLLAFAWWDLLKYFGANNTRLWAIKTYGSTQLAKYVPGNIMHLASRQAIGMASGVNGWTLAKSSIWELGLISIAGALFSILAIPAILRIENSLILAIVFIGIILVIVFGLSKIIGLTIARAFGEYTAFLIISGTIFTGLLTLLNSEDLAPLAQTSTFTGSFVIAWLVGLITPGAPAGVGVRELVLMMLLKGQVNEADLLTAVLLSRVVTVVGDVLFFLVAISIDRGKKILA